MHQNERPCLPFTDQMRKNHRFTCTGRQANDLARDSTQRGRLDGREGVTLVGAELN